MNEPNVVIAPVMSPWTGTWRALAGPRATSPSGNRMTPPAPTGSEVAAPCWPT